MACLDAKAIHGWQAVGTLQQLSLHSQHALQADVVKNMKSWMRKWSMSLQEKRCRQMGGTNGWEMVQRVAQPQ